MGSHALARLHELRALTKPTTAGQHKAHSATQIGIQFGTHAVAGVLSKATPNGLFGIGQLRADVIALAVTGFGALVAGGKRPMLRASAISGVIGSGHAILGRLIADTKINIVQGPDGRLKFT